MILLRTLVRGAEIPEVGEIKGGDTGGSSWALLSTRMYVQWLTDSGAYL